MKNLFLKSIFVMVCMLACVSNISAQISLSKYAQKVKVVTTDTVVRVSDLTLDQKEDILTGEVKAYNPDHKNSLGWERHQYYVGVLGGGNYVLKSFNPTATVRGGFETCHYLFEVEASYSRQKYTSSADASGTYNTFAFTGNVGWKFWQNKVKTTYLAVLLNAGYGLQQTDSKSSEVFSRNYGATGGAMLRCSSSLTKRVKVIAEAGYKIYPITEHNSRQKWGTGGPFGNIGVAYVFKCK